MLKSNTRRAWIESPMELKPALLRWERLKLILQTSSANKHLSPRFSMLCPKSLPELLRMLQHKVEVNNTTKVGAIGRISRPRRDQTTTWLHKRGWLIRKSSEYKWNSSR